MDGRCECKANVEPGSKCTTCQVDSDFRSTNKVIMNSRMNSFDCVAMIPTAARRAVVHF